MRINVKMISYLKNHLYKHPHVNILYVSPFVLSHFTYKERAAIARKSACPKKIKE